nr:mechanosensitive ion channel family protein [Paenibacillus sp. Marseille-Q4541]
MLLTGTTPPEDPTVTEAVNDAVGWVQRITDGIWNWFTDADMWIRYTGVLLQIIIVFVLTRIVIKVLHGIIDKSLLNKESERKIRINTRRVNTVGELLKNVVSMVCNFILVLLILSQLGVNLGPVLASAGVLGLAIGFGAQSLVKDIITGFFIILEDQFAVGDVIQSGTLKGTVVMIGLRTTKIVSFTGEVHIIPNGGITTVTNFSMANSKAVVDIPMKGEEQLGEAMRLIKEAVRDLPERNSNVVSVPEVVGIQSMSTAEYVIRVVAECLPNVNHSVERVIQMDVKEALEYKEHIRMAELESAAAREDDETGDGSGGA